MVRSRAVLNAVGGVDFIALRPVQSTRLPSGSVENDSLGLVLVGGVLAALIGAFTGEKVQAISPLDR